MGVWRRIRRRPRARRALAVAVVVTGAAAGAVGCEPGTTMSSVAVSYTTDELATRELERRGAGVQWLTCTANFGDRGGAAPSASERTVAEIDCEGRTDDGREITVTGRVTRAVDGACVRGDLTAKVGGKQLFRVSGLGDCGATAAPPIRQPGGRPGGPGATATVTVTRTVWCHTDPECWPEGK
ncbi:hypothetical protein [Streptomyces sp. NPDC006610]|uniref:hypothetical protein n=1 Tax=Streptomyces sp. NPDC006610 TaxID=3154584 RepID=UPI0033BCC109